MGHQFAEVLVLIENSGNLGVQRFPESRGKPDPIIITNQDKPQIPEICKFLVFYCKTPGLRFLLNHRG
ncbi:MAG: hypothetical protein CVU43_11995 [Chloroflexi bacterium HGW-Chloroflexi-5]|nr:MAG: hypothetical protein CVU43_11995 [Chloroflexi bacterium HGW-Chloroflexi-5]